MFPVSSSSSFSRQQRAQPSHRLSHSALDISSNVLVFQKNPSWPETGLCGAVTESVGFQTGSVDALLGGGAAAMQAERTGKPKKPGAALILTIKIVSQTIGLWRVLG